MNALLALYYNTFDVRVSVSVWDKQFLINASSFRAAIFCSPFSSFVRTHRTMGWTIPFLEGGGGGWQIPKENFEFPYKNGSHTRRKQQSSKLNPKSKIM